MFNDLDLYNKKYRNLFIRYIIKTVKKNNFIFDKNVDDLEKN